IQQLASKEPVHNEDDATLAIEQRVGQAQLDNVELPQQESHQHMAGVCVQLAGCILHGQWPRRDSVQHT
ncbi:unnamed protein product, partial [Closterium sp. NIES-64]